MEIEIRPGTAEDTDALGRLYDGLNDYLAASVNYPGWHKGIYPVRRDAADGIAEGCLYAAVCGGDIAGSMILRHRQEPAYSAAAWQAELDDSRVLAIYTFAVDPGYLRCGVGARMLDFASRFASEQDVKALRLDVYEKNYPAIKLYEKCGFNYIDTVSLGLEAYGLDRFRLYEKLL